jgi:hypothetical protein
MARFFCDNRTSIELGTHSARDVAATAVQVNHFILSDEYHSSLASVLTPFLNELTTTNAVFRGDFIVVNSQPSGTHVRFSPSCGRVTAIGEHYSLN